MASNRNRAASGAQGSSKRRKLVSSQSHPKGIERNGSHWKASSDKEKEKGADRRTIPLPAPDKRDEIELCDQDLEVLLAYGDSATFLNNLDEKRITMSKKESERLHQLNKPVRMVTMDDDLPSVNSHDEDSCWDSEIGDNDYLSLPDSEDQEGRGKGRAYLSDFDSDAELPYEVVPRKRRHSWSSEENQVNRLPIKLADGRIQKAKRIAIKNTKDENDEEETVVEQVSSRGICRIEDVCTGARFGKAAVVDIIGNKSRIARIQGAKEQIAEICQEIISEPENGLGLLRRLHTFSLTEISTPTHPDPIKNDLVIRKLAILSQLTVFKDLIPGYRIRSLTEKEKAEKVSQMVARTREWEQGLVAVYQSYLCSLEAELKAKTELAEIALQSMCTLACDVTHFNFRVNLMNCIVACLSKRSWDKNSDLCLRSIIKIFQADITGAASLELVRLLNRMIKEKRFNVHPDVLSCLLHLRLKTELGVRASESKAEKNDGAKVHSNGRAAARRTKGRPTNQAHLSKKAKKALKEKKEIEREFREAEADVDVEERAVTQTETLKLLFVLYFRILKNPEPNPLLPAALQGISRFTHLVNIDFFKDLMVVLKELIVRGCERVEDGGETDAPKQARDIRHRVLCIVTAFDLLSGQGEALNIDLSDFISWLYTIILPLSLIPDIDTPPDTAGARSQSTVDMLFRALNLIFSPRAFGAVAPHWRSAAFAKRLLTASLHWTPETALRAIDFVGGLITKDPKLQALLSTEDRMADGFYRPDVDDPQLCNPFGTSFWELHVLRQHCDAKVREAAMKLFNISQS